MTYAAYREHPGVTRTRSSTLWQVLDVTVTCADAQRVRLAIARCPDADRAPRQLARSSGALRAAPWPMT